MDPNRNKIRTALVMSLIACGFSLVALIFTFLRVEVHIQHETFVGTIATLIGVMITFALGFQIINYMKFERKVETKINDKIAETGSRTEHYIKEKLLELNMSMLRDAIIDERWETALKIISITIDDIVNAKNEHYAQIIVDCLISLSNDKKVIDIEFSTRTLQDLLRDISKLNPLLDEPYIQNICSIIVFISTKLSLINE